MTRRLLAPLALGAATAVLGAGFAAAPAEAAGYRYWSFWNAKDGAWAYASQGPGVSVPGDGSTVGFRFAVSADSADASKPRGAADFAAVCADTAARDGEKRVAVVVDPGTPEDAPEGERPTAARTGCARLDEDATAAEALAQVAPPLRYDDSGMICAIAGYPRTGCGEQVSGEDTATAGPAPSAAAPSAAPSEPAAADDGGPSVGVLAGMAAIVALGAAGIWQARRRRG
ncbi:SCO2322 family protein [Streptomyces sp. NPDC060194]|uniref:SCO2322 family protein n=1 Tax=Streptomyces sp. NPDC060194 TaxID=3347069 RepID=UPI00365105D1